MRPELLTQLRLAVGDRIVIGRTEFTIRGVVLSERIRANGQPNRTESFLVNASTGEVSRE